MYIKHTQLLSHKNKLKRIRVYNDRSRVVRAGSGRSIIAIILSYCDVHGDGGSKKRDDILKPRLKNERIFFYRRTKIVFFCLIKSQHLQFLCYQFSRSETIFEKFFAMPGMRYIS